MEQKVRAFTRASGRKSFPQAVDGLVLLLALWSKKFVLLLALWSKKLVLLLALIRAFTRAFGCKQLILQGLKGNGGEWLAVFYRKEMPKDTLPLRKDSFDPDLEQLVGLLVETSGEPEHKGWWTQCARSLGRDGVFRAVGQFEEKCRLEDLDNPGAMLTAILKDIARQQKVKIC